MTTKTKRLEFVPDDVRVRRLNAEGERPAAKGGECVVYWCQMQRRPDDNAALDYAILQANRLGVPCVVYEALRSDYPFASDRLHTFVVEGVEDMRAGCEARGLLYAFFLPKTPAEARGVVRKLAKRAALVVTDDYPTFVVADHLERAGAALDCPLIAVDDCAGVPMGLFPHAEFAARTLRPKLLRVRDEWLHPLQEAKPKVAAPKRFEWPFDPLKKGSNVQKAVLDCEIDHSVAPVSDEFPGSVEAGKKRLAAFVKKKLSGYVVDRNEPDRDGTSHLSPYLHWGRVSARAVALAVKDEGYERGLTAETDGFLEQLLVRRGLAFNYARHQPLHRTFEGLPTWAKKTLDEHAHDARPADVTLGQMEKGHTPDELWNAAQRELLRRGIIQNYPRMLWGKIPMLWTKSAKEAHERIVYLNDKYAIDGRDPDGYSNINWCFGLHDRPWPERAIYGKVRTMTSKSARSKLDFEAYIAQR